MTRFRLPLICECLLFLIPLNVYCIGNYLATGVQWALFRYQTSAFGSSLIFVNRDLLYVSGGILKGSSATSTLVWIAATISLAAALVTLIWAAVQDEEVKVRYARILTILGGALFFIAMLVQYGPALSSDHGYSLPVGVPVVIATGFWLAFSQASADREAPAKEHTPQEDTDGPG